MTHIQVQNLKKKKVLVMFLKYTPVTQNIPCLIFLMYGRNTQRLNYGGQESKKNNLQFMILLHLWPWTGSRSSNLVWIGRPRTELAYCNVQSCKVWHLFTFMASEEIPMCKFATCPLKLSPLNTHRSPTIDTVHDLLNDCNNHKIFKPHRQES